MDTFFLLWLVLGIYLTLAFFMLVLRTLFGVYDYDA